MPRNITVRCTFEIEIPVPEDLTDDDLRFEIEENGCPGTGRVGAQFDVVYENCNDTNVCWACNLKGESKIIAGLSTT